MHATFRLENPDAMDASMTIVMSLGDWKRMAGQLDASPLRGASPAWDVIQTIKRLTAQAEERFHHHEGEQP